MKGIEELLAHLMHGIDDDDQVGLTFRNQSEPYWSFWLSFRLAQNMSVENVLQAMERLYNATQRF